MEGKMSHLKDLPFGGDRVWRSVLNTAQKKRSKLQSTIFSFASVPPTWIILAVESPLDTDACLDTYLGEQKPSRLCVVSCQRRVAPFKPCDPGGSLFQSCHPVVSRGVPLWSRRDEYCGAQGSEPASIVGNAGYYMAVSQQGCSRRGLEVMKRREDPSQKLILIHTSFLPTATKIDEQPS